MQSFNMKSYNVAYIHFRISFYDVLKQWSTNTQPVNSPEGKFRAVLFKRNNKSYKCDSIYNFKFSISHIRKTKEKQVNFTNIISKICINKNIISICNKQNLLMHYFTFLYLY